MLRRSFVVGVGVLLLVALATTVATASSRDHSRTIRVVERAVSDTVVDLGAPGDSVGDMLTFGNDVFNAKNVVKVGRDEGACFRTNPGLAWECTWTTILAHGSISVQGPFYDDLRNSSLAITGGTGRYSGAQGQMTLHARDAAGSAFDFIFRLSR
jgi:Allene oxide cyclase